MRDLKPIRSATGSWDVLAARAQFVAELRDLLGRFGWATTLAVLRDHAVRDGREALADGLSVLEETARPAPPGAGDPRSPEEVAAAWAALSGGTAS